MSSPTTAAGTEVARGRPDAARLLAAANQSTKVAGSKTTETSEKVEKLATSERSPIAARRPPTDSGVPRPGCHEGEQVWRGVHQGEGDVAGKLGGYLRGLTVEDSHAAEAYRGDDTSDGTDYGRTGAAFRLCCIVGYNSNPSSC